MHLKVWGTAVAGLLLSQAALGANDPQSMDVGGFKFTPTVGISGALDDNIFSQPGNEVESWITRLAPELRLMADTGGSTYELSYVGDYGLYDNSADDDYTDHTVAFNAFFDAGARNRFAFDALYGMLHDNRGEGSSEGPAGPVRGEPDEYDLTQLSGMWDFGAEGNLLGFTLTAASEDIQYQNNRVATQFRDRSDIGVTGRLNGNLTGKTTYFVEVGSKDIEYDTLPLFGDTLDSSETSAYIGAKWEMTGATSSEAKIGRMKKEFDATSRGEDTFTAWNVAVAWAPRTYSRINFSSGRTPYETNGSGSFVEATDHRVSWDHDVSELVHFNVSYGIGHDRFPGAVFARTDDRLTWSAGMNFDLARQINFGASYSHERRDSSLNIFDYTKNVMMFTLNMSL